MEDPPPNGRFQGTIGPYFQFIKQMRCVNDNSVDNDNISSEMLDEDSMRCVALDCMVALQKVEMEKKTRMALGDADEQHENAKNRVFAAAVSMIMDDDKLVDANPALHSLLTTFLKKKKITDGRTWLPMHFALAFGDRIEEDCIHLLYSRHPVTLQQYHRKKSEDNNNSEASFLQFIFFVCSHSQICR
jgi:hypothetical protein